MQLSNFLEIEKADILDNVERVQNVVLTEQGILITQPRIGPAGMILTCLLKTEIRSI